MSFRKRTRQRVLLAAAALAVAVAHGGCERLGAGGAPGRRPDVIVFVVDSLRRDHLDLYGYRRATGPQLRAFADDAVVFTNAYSTSSWAAPAIGSLLGGFYSHRRGAGSAALPPEVFTLPEYLGRAGYRSVGLSANPAIGADPGFAQGFAAFDVLAGASADAVVTAALDHLGRSDAATPLLLYVQVSDPRGPYAPPPRYLENWPPKGAGPFDPGQIDPATPALIVADLHAAYDGEIAFADAEFGRLVEALRGAERYDDAMIIFAASHGEELQEHGGGGHGRTLFEEVVAIPMVIKFPRNAGAGEFVHGPVSLVDILPTVLPVAGVATNAKVDGLDLAHVVEGQGQQLRDRALYFALESAEAGAAAFKTRAVLQHGDKYIDTAGVDDSGALYRLALDPFEQRDVAASERSRAQRLARLLERPGDTRGESKR